MWWRLKVVLVVVVVRLLWVLIVLMLLLLLQLLACCWRLGPAWRRLGRPITEYGGPNYCALGGV